MKHKSLNETAYSIIRDKILNGEFELGSRLREDLIAEEISMSRTPVREAINRLVADGLIKNRVRKGLYLIQPEDHEIEEYIDIRLALEKLSVEKCISSITDEQKNEISQSIKNFEKALARDDFDTCNELDADFHMMIARISGNLKLVSLLREFSAFFQLARRTEKKLNPQTKNERTLQEHILVANAILSGEVEVAKQAIVDNIETMRTNLHSQPQRTETTASPAKK